MRVSSKRWSRNESDIEPEKSSIGEISSKISSRPERSGTSVRPASLASGHAGLPALVAEQPVEALRLESEEVGDLQGFANLGERQTA